MTAAGRKVNIERRVDQVAYYVKDHVAYNINYYGQTEFFDALDSDPVWQIKRVVTAGSVERTLFAQFGKYNCQWNIRTSYFPAEPAPISDPGMATYPSGLRNGGLLTFVTLDDTLWTALPPTPLTGRNALSIQNQSDVEIRTQFINTDPIYRGVMIAASSERFYDVTDSIVIYARAAVGTPVILIEELS